MGLRLFWDLGRGMGSGCNQQCPNTKTQKQNQLEPRRARSRVRVVRLLASRSIHRAMPSNVSADMVVTTTDQQHSFLTRFPNGVQHPARCPNKGSFVTWMSGDSYLLPALCLKRQFIRVNSVCRLVLVYDDISARLSSSVFSRIESAYGVENVIAISQIMANLERQKNATAAATTMEVALSRRRLFHNILQTVPKLWIWALPPDQFPRLAYMDLDVFVNENIDDLLGYDFDTSVLAVSCPRSAWYQGRRPRFNAGVLVLKPNVKIHSELLHLARFTRFPWNGYVPRNRMVRVEATNETKQWYDVCAPDDGCERNECLAAQRFSPNASEPLRDCRYAFKGEIAYRIERACASKIGDQAIHNHVLRNRASGGFLWEQWTPLGAMGINVDARGLRNLSGARLIHFLGEPKPWEHASHGIADSNAPQADHGRDTASRHAYRSTCADLF